MEFRAVKANDGPVVVDPVLAGARACSAEGPRWHAERGELLWVDILGRRCTERRPDVDGALESVETITVDRHVGAVAPGREGGYVLAAGTGFLHVDDAGRCAS